MKLLFRDVLEKKNYSKKLGKILVLQSNQAGVSFFEFAVFKKNLLTDVFQGFSVLRFLKLTELIFLTSNATAVKTIDEASYFACAEAALSSNYFSKSSI